MISTTDNRRRRLPATEALQDLQRRCLQRPYRRVTASPPSETTIETNESFDMTEMISATAPLEEDLYAFPKIEWTLDDESDHKQTLNMSDLSNAQDDHFNSSSHHSHSSPILGKRPRIEYHGRLVRSKSLKSSLCYLAEQSMSHRQRRGSVKTNKGSWGQFVQNDDDQEEDKIRPKLAVPHHHATNNRADQLFLRSPYLMFGADDQSGLE